MALEQYAENKIDNETQLKWEIEDALKSLRSHENKLADDTISNLSETQLATYIETTFKNKETWAWADYNTMKNNNFYGFMVQSSLDLLSDIFGDKKYNKDGKVAPDNTNSNDYKSLDGWLASGWWIDNKLGGKSKTAVRIAQKLLNLNVDWEAGPQFFEKVCSILRWESDVDANFSVQWRDNYTFNFNENNRLNNSDAIVDNSADMELTENEKYLSTISNLEEVTNVDKAYYWIPRKNKVFKYKYSSEYCYVDWSIVKRIPIFWENSEFKNQLPSIQTMSITELKKQSYWNWMYAYPHKCDSFKDQYTKLLKDSFGDINGKSVEYENWYYYIKSYNQKFKIDYHRNSDVWWSKWSDYIKINFRLWDLCNKIKSQNITWGTFSYVNIGNGNYLLTYSNWNTHTDIVNRSDSINLYWWFNEGNVDRARFLQYLNNSVS